MENGKRKQQSFAKIDSGMFFGLLKEKLEDKQREVVAAPLAESVLRPAIDRVLACSDVPRDRISKARKRLYARMQSLKG